MIGCSSLRLFLPCRTITRPSLSRRSIDTRPCILGRRFGALKTPVRAHAQETNENGTIGPHPIDFEELTDLIKMVNDSDIVDFEMENNGMNLSIKKAQALEERVVQTGESPSPPTPTYSMPPPPSPQTNDAPTVTAPPPPPPAAPVKEDKSPDGLQIVSPMSGTFYAAPAPGEPTFVAEGDRVNAGQTVCIIEAMKLMNEIEAEISGEVAKILVQNGQSITAGQALMIVKPL